MLIGGVNLISFSTKSLISFFFNPFPLRKQKQDGFLAVKSENLKAAGKSLVPYTGASFGEFPSTQ
jgi:hypothetical protein